MKHNRAQESPEKKKLGTSAAKDRMKHNRAQESPEKTKTKSKLKTMEESIKILKQKALQAFQRTQDENDGSRHSAHVCIIYDCFIIKQ
jgi:hypothetical protein